MKAKLLAGIAVILVAGLAFTYTQLASHQPPTLDQSKECLADEDCIPATCCHPDSCVSKEQAPDCSGIFCTMECAPNTMDCGQGSCTCVENKCEVKWAE